MLADGKVSSVLKCCAGPSVQENHKEVLLKLIRTLRRFFAPEAAQEIWAFFRPKLLTLHPDFQEASPCSLSAQEKQSCQEAVVDTSCQAPSSPAYSRHVG